MVDHLPRDAPTAFVDSNGRRMQTLRDGEFEILFWIDPSAQELRVVEIEFVYR